jgi:hypothetical protein
LEHGAEGKLDLARPEGGTLRGAKAHHRALEGLVVGLAIVVAFSLLTILTRTTRSRSRF